MLLGPNTLKATAPGPDDSRTRLDRAWTEYSFQAFDMAEALFQEVAQQHPQTNTRNLEARAGLAMIRQFDTRRQDLAQALREYRTLLAEGLDGEPAILVQALLAECISASGNLAEANRLWDELIRTHTESIVAQDALLQRTYHNMTSWHSPETAQAIAYLQDMRTLFPAPTPDRPGLSPTFDATIGNYYFWNEDYESARDAFIRYTDIANTRNTSYAWVAGMLFRVARISELHLHDTVTAGAYYRRVAIETRNAAQSYFALMKAAEFQAITPAEVRQLRIPGMTEDLIRELFRPREDNHEF